MLRLHPLMTSRQAARGCGRLKAEHQAEAASGESREPAWLAWSGPSAGLFGSGVASD